MIVESRLVRRGRQIVERRVFSNGTKQERVVGAVKPVSFFRAIEKRLLDAMRDEARETVLHRRTPAFWPRPECAPKGPRTSAVPGRGPVCWSCASARVPVYGVPCRKCFAVIRADYLKRRDANGGQPLFVRAGA